MSLSRPFIGAVLALLLIMGGAGCRSREPEHRPGKLQVVATLFPLYDMARAIGGAEAEVSLLLPPGTDAHSFEPRPGDILRLNRADLFVYTGPFMEPWAESLLRGLDNRGLTAVNAGRGITLLHAGGGASPGDGHHHEEGGDPHIWLDAGNARTMLATILAGFTARDPAHAESYRRNAAAYDLRLEELDRACRTALADCGSRTVVHAGHFAFGYLAKRYGLRYLSAYPSSGEGEPTARQVAALVELVRTTGSGTIFYEELASPRLADTLARETGARLLRLSSAHTVSREELARGVTFPEIMARNLESLREGLRCR